MNENNDPLIKMFRKRLKDYEQPVEKDVWTDIERDLQNRKTVSGKRSQLLWMCTGIAASVALIVALFVFNQPDMKKQTPILAQKGQLPLPATELAPSLAESNAKPISNVLGSKKISKQPNSALCTSKEETKVVENPTISIKKDTKRNNLTASNDQAEKAENKRETVENRKKTTLASSDDLDDDLWTTPRKKKKKNIAFALAMGNSGTAPDDIAASGNGPLYADLANTISNSPEIIIPPGAAASMPYYSNSNPTQYDYDIPVSVGFSVRKYFTDIWAVESGLTYTYLSSKETTHYPNNGVEINHISLHYVGIPVKGICSFYNTDRVSIYLAAGGMVEKSVYGQKKTTVKSGSSTEKLNVPELQFSIFGNIGINVRLFNHFGLFIEPGISYYFDDKSDVMTIRKDCPTNINVQGGIRLTY